MKHLGDITKINGAEIEPVDCITAGSPCQDLSVAGKRAGLEGERSGLFMEQIRIIKEMRKADEQRGRTDEFIRPRYMVWENVPGALSSNKGEDFRCVLEETVRIVQEDADIPGPPKNGWPYSGCIMGDGWSIAWRIHDAQFWGVPQRRKRIALIADFGGMSAPEILFERKSLSGDIAKSGKEGQGIAENASGSVGKTDATFYDAYQHHGWRESDTSGTLTAGQNNSVRGDTPLIVEDMKAIGFNRERCGAVAMDDAMPTLQAAAGESGNNQPMVVLSFQERAGKPGGGKGILIQNERTGALSTLNNQMVFDARGNGDGKTVNTLAGDYQDRVTDYTALCVGNGQMCNITMKPLANTLDTMHDQQAVVISNLVRRLTPMECERLQGFPDGWTDIGEWIDTKGKKHKPADSPRYKALGNSIALPFWFYLLRRISAQYERPATLGSLFDGIGGFPLCWERCNGRGTARWASEIEEFPIAVTKYHFGEE